MIKKTTFVCVIMLAGLATLQAQTIEKARGRAGGRSYSYSVLRPSHAVKGVVILMPSRGETPKKLFWHTSIPRHLAAHGFVTAVPKVDYALILEKDTKDILDQIAAVEIANAALPASRLFIGGFSSGGAIAAHYAENRIAEKGEASVNGLFLIDPPLDLARCYNAWTKLIDSSCPEIILSEAEFIKTYIEKTTGGTPVEQPDSYLKFSAFTATDSSGGNARFLKNLPIRLYTEPDLKAMQARYCPALTYENLNSSDLDALNRCLTRLGNAKVEYIRTTGRGLHSWTIVDPEDLVEWIERNTP